MPNNIDFLCPNGTVFHQQYLVCVWWNQFECSTAASLYGINAYIYDYSINGVLQQMAGYSQNGAAGGSRSQITPTTAQQDGGQFPTISDGSRGYPQAPGSINLQGNNPQQGGGQTAERPGSYSGANGEFPRGPAITSPQQGGGQFPTDPGVSRGYPQVPSSINPPQGGSPSVSTTYQFPTQPSGYPGATQAVSGGSVGKDTTSSYQTNPIGYPREQPSVPFPGTKPQPPNREYLPPINGK